MIGRLLTSARSVVLNHLGKQNIAACDTSPEVAEYDFVDYVAITEWNEQFTTLSAESVNEILAAADVGNAIRLVSGLNHYHEL